MLFLDCDFQPSIELHIWPVRRSNATAFTILIKWGLKSRSIINTTGTYLTKKAIEAGLRATGSAPGGLTSVALQSRRERYLWVSKWCHMSCLSAAVCLEHGIIPD